MTLIVEQGDPRNPQATALLQASHSLMASLFPAEDNHYLSINALCEPNIHFYIVRDGRDIIGCAALADKKAYGELKSMFITESARGKGAADALMRQLEDQARILQLALMKLETGNLLHAAHKLYERHGFRLCGAFGDYSENNTSIFMEKRL